MAQCEAQASCLAPNPGSYGIARATIPEPIIRAHVAIIDIQPVRANIFNKAGVRKTAAALAAVIAIDEPKYKYVSWTRSRTYCGQILQSV